MAGKKGMKQYLAEIRAKVVTEQHAGAAVHSLSRKYGISIWAIRTWCGLTKEKKLMEETKKRGRPRKNPIEKQRELELRIKELEREVVLYKAFLQASGNLLNKVKSKN